MNHEHNRKLSIWRRGREVTPDASACGRSRWRFGWRSPTVGRARTERSSRRRPPRCRGSEPIVRPRTSRPPLSPRTTPSRRQRTSRPRARRRRATHAGQAKRRLQVLTPPVRPATTAASSGNTATTPAQRRFQLETGDVRRHHRRLVRAAGDGRATSWRSWLRMPDYGWKISLVLGTLAASIVIVSLGEFKFGPDLAGGITLIYELAESQSAVDGAGAAQDRGGERQDAGPDRHPQAAHRSDRHPRSDDPRIRSRRSRSSFRTPARMRWNSSSGGSPRWASSSSASRPTRRQPNSQERGHHRAGQAALAQLKRTSRSAAARWPNGCAYALEEFGPVGQEDHAATSSSGWRATRPRHWC